MANRKFAYSVLFLGMVIFLSIPLYYLSLGIVLPVHVILLSFSLAIAFGFFGTRQAMMDEEEKGLKKNMYDMILKIPCPLCKGVLVELTSPKNTFVLNYYKGLVYCRDCYKFEMSKDEFDREYRPNG